MVKWQLSGLLLMSVACSWVAQTWARDEFYLTLVPSATECPDGGINGELELADDVIAMEEASSGSGGGLVGLVVDDDMNETCAFSAEEVKVECSCGDRLLRTRQKYEERVKRTCDRYDQLSDSSSPLSFCERSLHDLQPSYKICSTSAAAQTTDDSPLTFTNASLAEKVQEIENQVSLFRMTLDRTITGVLVASNFSKCLCMDRYKRWLCATHLPVYIPSNSTHFNICTNTTNTNSTLTRLKPSVTVCNRVLQSCPYYTPSRLQIQRPQAEGVKEEFEEVVYGGYPAFDCPRERYAGQESSYSFSCPQDNCSFCFEYTTRNTGHTPYSSTVVTMISILLFILLIRTVH